MKIKFIIFFLIFFLSFNINAACGAGFKSLKTEYGTQCVPAPKYIYSEGKVYETSQIKEEKKVEQHIVDFYKGGHFFANMICKEAENSAGPIPTEAVSLLAAIGIDPEVGSNFNSSFNTKMCDCVQKRTRLRISPERIKEVNRKYKINPKTDNLINDSEALFFATLSVTCALFLTLVLKLFSEVVKK